MKSVFLFCDFRSNKISFWNFVLKVRWHFCKACRICVIFKRWSDKKSQTWLLLTPHCCRCRRLRSLSTAHKIIEWISVEHDDALHSMCKYISSCCCFISDSWMHLSPFFVVIHRDYTELSNRCYFLVLFFSIFSVVAFVIVKWKRKFRVCVTICP